MWPLGFHTLRKKYKTNSKKSPFLNRNSIYFAALKKLKEFQHHPSCLGIEEYNLNEYAKGVYNTISIVCMFYFVNTCEWKLFEFIWAKFHLFHKS